MQGTENLYITSGARHPNVLAQRLALALVSRITGTPVRRARTIDAIAELDPTVHRLCVAYFHCPVDRPDLVSKLDAYVRAGGALLALHSVSASFKGNALFEELLGGVFIRHDPIARLEVRRADTVGPGLFTVTDEPYEHRVSGQVSVTYRWRSSATTDGGGQSGEPCVWLRERGRGRVAYLSLGHRSAVWRVPGVEFILRGLIQWCVGEELE